MHTTRVLQHQSIFKRHQVVFHLLTASRFHTRFKTQLKHRLLTSFFIIKFRVEPHPPKSIVWGWADGPHPPSHPYLRMGGCQPQLENGLHEVGRVGIGWLRLKKWSSRIGSQQIFVISTPLGDGSFWSTTSMCLCMIEYDDVEQEPDSP